MILKPYMGWGGRGGSRWDRAQDYFRTSGRDQDGAGRPSRQALGGCCRLWRETGAAEVGIREMGPPNGDAWATADLLQMCISAELLGLGWSAVHLVWLYNVLCLGAASGTSSLSLGFSCHE